MSNMMNEDAFSFVRGALGAAGRKAKDAAANVKKGVQDTIADAKHAGGAASVQADISKVVAKMVRLARSMMQAGVTESAIIGEDWQLNDSDLVNLIEMMVPGAEENLAGELELKIDNHRFVASIKEGVLTLKAADAASMAVLDETVVVLQAALDNPDLESLYEYQDSVDVMASLLYESIHLTESEVADFELSEDWKSFVSGASSSIARKIKDKAAGAVRGARDGVRDVVNAGKAASAESNARKQAAKDEATARKNKAAADKNRAQMRSLANQVQQLRQRRRQETGGKQGFSAVELRRVIKQHAQDDTELVNFVEKMIDSAGSQE